MSCCNSFFTFPIYDLWPCSSSWHIIPRNLSSNRNSALVIYTTKHFLCHQPQHMRWLMIIDYYWISGYLVRIQLASTLYQLYLHYILLIEMVCIYMFTCLEYVVWGDVWSNILTKITFEKGYPFICLTALPPWTSLIQRAQYIAIKSSFYMNTCIEGLIYLFSFMYLHTLNNVWVGSCLL